MKVQLCVIFTAGQSEGKRCCWSVEKIKITKYKRIFSLSNQQLSSISVSKERRSGGMDETGTLKVPLPVEIVIW